MTSYVTHGSIGYLDRLPLYKTEKPYASAIVPWNTPGAYVSNLRISYYRSIIQDMRHSADDFSMDIQGFELTRFSTSLTGQQLRNQESLRKEYFPEAEAFLKKRCGGEMVHIFDATIRNVAHKGYDPGAELRSEQIMGVAPDAHVDQTPDSVYRRLKRNLPNEFEVLKARRIRVINIWRPLVEPLRDRPLAMCDWRTTRPEDYVPCDLPSHEYIGEIMEMHHNPAHKWWFASDMVKEEVLLIKMYDSEAEKPGSDIAMCTPHCSFEWKDVLPEYAPRESMEIRAIVVS